MWKLSLSSHYFTLLTTVVGSPLRHHQHVCHHVNISSVFFQYKLWNFKLQNHSLIWVLSILLSNTCQNHTACPKCICFSDLICQPFEEMYEIYSVLFTLPLTKGVVSSYFGNALKHFSFWAFVLSIKAKRLSVQTGLGLIVILCNSNLGFVLPVMYF